MFPFVTFGRLGCRRKQLRLDEPQIFRRNDPFYARFRCHGSSTRRIRVGFPSSPTVLRDSLATAAPDPPGLGFEDEVLPVPRGPDLYPMGGAHVGIPSLHA